MTRTQRPYGATDIYTAVFHRDGTVTIYCPHRGSWVRGFPSDSDLALRADAPEIIAHIGRHNQRMN